LSRRRARGAGRSRDRRESRGRRLAPRGAAVAQVGGAARGSRDLQAHPCRRAESLHGRVLRETAGGLLQDAGAEAMKTLGLLALLLGAPALAAPEPKTIAAAEPKAVATAPEPKRPAAAEPKAVADASKAEVSVGETFTVEVRASGPAGTAFEFPPDIVDESFELH